VKEYLHRHRSLAQVAVGLFCTLTIVTGGLAFALIGQHPWNMRAVSAGGQSTGRASPTKRTSSGCLDVTLDSAELYNPASGTWSPAPPPPMAVERGTLTPLGDNDGRLLLAGGLCETGTSTSGVSGAAAIYDPVTNTWTPTGSMNTPRANQAAVLLPSSDPNGGDVLVIGGLGANNNPLNSTELYSPATGTWTTTGSLNVSRNGPSAFVLTTGPNAGGVLVVSGFTGSYAQPYIPYVSELYNPTTGKWTENAALLSNTGDAEFFGTTLPNGDIFLAGGIDSDGEDRRDYLYDPVANTWKSLARHVTARAAGGGAVLANGDILTFGGISSNFCSSEVYHLSTGQWTPVFNPMIDCGLMGMTAQTLPNGEVLVAGGWAATGSGNSPQGGITADCELFDPTAQTWTATGAMSTPRRFAMSALLTTGPNKGDVLVVGGDNGAPIPLPTGAAARAPATMPVADRPGGWN